MTYHSTDDYVALVDTEVTFLPSTSAGFTQCVEVELTDDSIVEDTEQFSVSLESNTEHVLITSPSTAIYTIVDDDCKLSTNTHFYKINLLFSSCVGVPV